MMIVAVVYVPIALLKVIDRGMGILSLAVMSQPLFLLKEINHSFMALVNNTCIAMTNCTSKSEVFEGHTPL